MKTRKSVKQYQKAVQLKIKLDSAGYGDSGKVSDMVTYHEAKRNLYAFYWYWTTVALFATMTGLWWTTLLTQGTLHTLTYLTLTVLMMQGQEVNNPLTVIKQVIIEDEKALTEMKGNYHEANKVKVDALKNAYNATLITPIMMLLPTALSYLIGYWATIPAALALIYCISQWVNHHQTIKLAYSIDTELIQHLNHQREKAYNTPV